MGKGGLRLAGAASGLIFIGAVPALAEPADNAASAASPAPDAPDAPARGDIVVTGRRLAKTAREEQARAPNLVNIQSAETIAKYPDINAAEALSRVPGVSLSIDTAEGRFVNIRGLDGNLNGSTFGGVVLLNTQPGGTYFNASGRAVEFDTVPIGAIDRIVVTKTGLPEHDAEGLGGSVELTPRTAIGVDKTFAEVTLGGGYQPLRGRPLYRDEVVIGSAFGGRNADGKHPFSFVATQFLLNDRRGFDDIEGAYLNNQPTTPDKAYDALELRHYDYNRKRFGYSGEFDFTPNDDNRLYVRANYAGYNESVLRQRLEIDGLGDPLTVDPADAKGFVAPGASTVKTLRDERESHHNLLLQAGGEHHFGDVRLDYFAAFSRASYRKLYDYNTTFAGPSVSVAYDNITDPNHPRFTAAGPDIRDLANYQLDSIGNQTERDRDREYSYAANLTVPVGLLDNGEVQFGGKLRYRRKTSTPLSFSYGYTGATPVSATQFAGPGPYPDFYNYIDIGRGVDDGAIRQFLASNPSAFTPNTARDLSRNAGGFFDDSEDVSAGYVEYRGNAGPLGILAGARVEHTRSVYRGTLETTDAAGAVSYSPASTTRSYTNVFPTVQLRYQAAPSLVARATYSTGIARPGFYQTLQSSSVDVGGQSVTTGNPQLAPTYGNNFDLALEYYLPGSGIISLGAFDKRFRNYIVARTVRGSYPGITGTATISTFENVSGAYARGIEASFVDRFRGLPGLLDGLGVDLNATYADTSVTLREGENVALPGAIDLTANAALFYEAHRIKARLSGQYQAATLFGIGDSRAKDIFQDKRFTLDANVSYDLASNISVFGNAKNLTNAPLRFYEGTSNRPVQREFYDLTLEAGVKIRL